MPSLETFSAFLVAAALFAYMPGPATLYTTARTIAEGRRSGWLAAAGIHLGGYFQVVITALGLAVLFQAIPVLYLGLKTVGAAYLIWLGFSMFRTRLDASPNTARAAPSSRKIAFYDSAIVEILNPKTALFYLAFLPQFTDPVAGLPIWAQLLVLGTIVNVMFLSADVLCVVLADRMARFLRGSKRAGNLAQKLGGSVLIGLGVKMAVSQN